MCSDFSFRPTLQKQMESWCAHSEPEEWPRGWTELGGVGWGVDTCMSSPFRVGPRQRWKKVQTQVPLFILLIRVPWMLTGWIIQSF